MRAGVQQTAGVEPWEAEQNGPGSTHSALDTRSLPYKVHVPVTSRSRKQVCKSKIERGCKCKNLLGCWTLEAERRPEFGWSCWS